MASREKVMRYLSFEDFIQELKKAPAWMLEMQSDGLVLTVAEDQTGPRRRYHSPDPSKVTDLDWGLFSNRIGHVIDMRGGIV